MQLVFSWIRYNKFTFFILDSVLLIGNVIILNFIRNGSLINTDLISIFITANIFFCLIYLISKIWIWVTQKYNCIFIQIKYAGGMIAFYGVFFFIIINIILIFLIWIHKNMVNIFYFAMPWLIIIFANIYNSIINCKTNK